MKRLLSVLVLVSFYLTGCGCEDFRENRNYDRDLVPILELYLLHAPNKGRLDDLRVLRFGDPGEGADGFCYGKDKTVAGVKIYTDLEIIIRRPVGKDFGSNFYKRSVLHEFGHCLHNLGHDDSTFEIMGNPDNVDRTDFWAEHLIEKLDNMFVIGKDWKH